MLAVGQTWRTNDGKLVTVETMRTSGRAYVVSEYHPSIGYSVSKLGTPITLTDAHALKDRVTRVYIAGTAMAGDGRDANLAAEIFRGRGCFVINPAEIPLVVATSWVEQVRRDIPAMLSCEMIALLPGWENSKRAKLERLITIELGMSVVYPT